MQVKFLGKIRHPHLLGMMGFCLEPKCIVFEYMHNGSLKDTIFSSSSCGAIRALSWHTRIHVAAQICSGLSYLHLAKPIPIVHSQLTISNIFLDRNLVAKIDGFGLSQAHHESHVVSDVQAFGLLLIQLLTGRNWAGLVDEAMLVDKAALVQVLDKTGGAWPLDIVERLALLAFRCLGPTKLKVEVVMEELEELKKKCVELVDRRRGEISSTDGGEGHESCEIPCVFLCPIYKDVMRNPHVAADGFSYEKEAIEAWMRMGKDTSPMTNLKLKHNFLIPNNYLHSLITDWHIKRSIPPP
ncbi:putative U-box domain-containing protein 50 [Cannabis sativa]|uniref:putative U-box domain-containing protein 50 n=1 Tax=Cannabis sativa TaxID=3483 RepID=UPI0029CA3F23|nr:putative U-box domain-containing protein 50 [Cannabis sativa]